MKQSLLLYADALPLRQLQESNHNILLILSYLTLKFIVLSNVCDRPDFIFSTLVIDRL